jgi:hypothetical protein
VADLEKVINEIEEEIRLGEHWDETYRMVSLQLLNDILALLKEQEPIEPYVCGSKEPDGLESWLYLCGKCKTPIDHKDRFCKRCGQAVKWND